MTKKILVIEDDNIIQRAIEESLTGEGYEVIQAINGEKGSEAAKSQEPDLIILDLALPGEDGYHLLSSFRNDEATSDVPIIVLSVIDSPSSIAECKGLGAKGYFVKSKYSLEDMSNKIKELI